MSFDKGFRELFFRVQLKRKNIGTERSEEKSLFSLFIFKLCFVKDDEDSDEEDSAEDDSDQDDSDQDDSDQDDSDEEDSDYY